MAYDDSRFRGEPGFRDEPDFRVPEDAPTLTQLAGAFQTSKQKIVDLLVAMTQVPAFLQLEVTP